MTAKSLVAMNDIRTRQHRKHIKHILIRIFFISHRTVFVCAQPMKFNFPVCLKPKNKELDHLATPLKQGPIAKPLSADDIFWNVLRVWFELFCVLLLGQILNIKNKTHMINTLRILVYAIQIIDIIFTFIANYKSIRFVPKVQQSLWV